MVDIQRLEERLTLESAQQQDKLLETLLNKPFWIWNTEEHKHEEVFGIF